MNTCEMRKFCNKGGVLKRAIDDCLRGLELFFNQLKNKEIVFVQVENNNGKRKYSS